MTAVQDPSAGGLPPVSAAVKAQRFARQSSRARTANAIAHLHRLVARGVVPSVVARALSAQLSEAETVPALLDGRVHMELVAAVLAWPAGRGDHVLLDSSGSDG